MLFLIQKDMNNRRFLPLFHAINYRAANRRLRTNISFRRLHSSTNALLYPTLSCPRDLFRLLLSLPSPSSKNFVCDCEAINLKYNVQSSAYFRKDTPLSKPVASEDVVELQPRPKNWWRSELMRTDGEGFAYCGFGATLG